MNDTPDNQSIEAAAADWVARRDAAERWTPEQEAELRAWIAASPAHRIAWLRMSAAWRRMDQLAARAVVPAPATQDTSPVRPVIAAGRPPAARGPRRRTAAGWALAAGLAIGIGVTTVLQLRIDSGEHFATNVGGRESVTLADGSHITLNTRTRGRAVVNDQERRFWLEEGEAYFEVTHDPSRPFVVLAGRDRVTVLGTRFSVRHEGGRTEVTVLEGRVSLDRAEGGSGPVAPVVMTRNESAVSSAGNLLVIGKTGQQVANDLSWRDGRLVFDQLTLDDIAGQFNRYNDRQLVIEGDVAAMRFSGSFDARNVDGFARLARDSFGLTVRDEGNRIVITR